MCYVCLLSCYSPPLVRSKWLHNEWVCMQMAAPCWHDLFTNLLLWNCPDINILSWHLLNFFWAWYSSNWDTGCHLSAPDNLPFCSLILFSFLFCLSWGQWLTLTVFITFLISKFIILWRSCYFHNGLLLEGFMWLSAVRKTEKRLVLKCDLGIKLWLLLYYVLKTC